MRDELLKIVRIDALAVDAQLLAIILVTPERLPGRPDEAPGTSTAIHLQQGVRV